MKQRSSKCFHPDGFPIAIQRREPEEPSGPHRREFSEIVLVTGGQAIHVTNSESARISAGDVFVMSGERVHEYREIEGLHLVHIVFSQDHLRLDLWDLPTLAGYKALFLIHPARKSQDHFRSHVRLLPKELGVAMRHIEAMESELSGRQPGYAFAAAALFTQIIGYLSRCYSTHRDPTSEVLPRVAKAIIHLETHFTQEVNLESLTELAHMSNRSFLRAFRAATGYAPVTYLLKLRLARAAMLLQRREENVTSAAYEAGFNDSNYFARQFRKSYGLSPSAYRRQELRG